MIAAAASDVPIPKLPIASAAGWPGLERPITVVSHQAPPIDFSQALVFVRVRRSASASMTKGGATEIPGRYLAKMALVSPSP